VLAGSVDKLTVVQDFDNFKEPKTKQFNEVLKALNLTDKKVLLILDYACDACDRVAKAARNIEGLRVLHATNLNVKDILDCDAILTNARTLEAINNRFKAASKEDQGKAKEAKATKAAPKKAAAKSSKEGKEAAPKKAAPKKAASDKEAPAKKSAKKP